MPALWALARGLHDYRLQQGLPGSDEEEVMTTTHLRLASVHVDFAK